MKILITGAAGMLGSAMVPIFSRMENEVLPTDIDVNGPNIKYLDVRDRSQVMIVVRSFQPDVVVHLAAETDLERCEKNPGLSYETNALGTHNVASACKEKGTTMVYVSTAGVFDGRKGTPYTELDEPNPVNVYGKTKLEGERIVREELEPHFIVRAGWMMGGGMERDKKFVAKVLKQILQGKTVIFAVKDKVGTPTYTTDFSKNLASLISSRRYGLYHMVCHGEGTRYDVAKEIASLLPTRDIKVLPVNSDHFAEEYFAPRPTTETLENKRLNEIGCDRMRDWRECLREYLRTQFSEIM